MSIILNQDLDLLQLDALIADGWTTLKLYAANSPDGNFTDSSATVSPTTLALLLTAEEPYRSTFTHASGNAAQYFKIVAYNGAATSNLNDAKTFHGGGGTTLQMIRQRTGKAMKLLETGTTTAGGGTTTAICTTPSFTRHRDNYYGGGSTSIDGWIFHNLSTHEWSEISGWVASTGTFTFGAITSVGNGENFEVLSRFTPNEYRDAINWAISYCFPKLSVPIIDISITTVDDVYTYDIPNNIKIINKVEIESDSNPDSTALSTRGQPWKQIPYVPYDDGLQRKIEFKRNKDFDVSRRIRITGTSMLNQMYNDNDYCEIIDPQLDLLCYVAAHRLYAQLANTDSASDIDRWKAQANYYLSMYVDESKSKGSRRKAKKIWQAEAQWSG
jgi:hypothetical protein